MRLFFYSLTLLFACLAYLPFLQAEAQKTPSHSSILQGLDLAPLSFSIPKFHKQDLPYQAQLFSLVDSDLPLIRLSMYFQGGTKHEALARAGILQASLALLLEGGTAKQKGSAFSAALSEIGASLQFASAQDSWSLHLQVLSPYFPQAWQMLKELMLKPALPESKLKDIKNALLVKIRARNEKPSAIAARRLQELMYPTLRRGYFLRKEDAAKLSVQEIKKELQARINPEGAFVTVSGDFSRYASEIEESLSAFLHALHKAHISSKAAKQAGRQGKEVFDLAKLRAANAFYRNKIVLVEKQSAQSAIRVGAYLPPHNHQDFYALQLANHVLGGSSFNSRLVRKIRVEEGLAYYAYSYNRFGSDDALFQAGCGTKNAKAASALAMLLEQIQSARKIRPAELALAKKSILHALVFQFDKSYKILSEEVRFRLHNMPPRYLEQFPLRLQKQSLADLERAASTYWKQDDLYIVVVGPASLEAELSEIAPVIKKELDEKFH